MTTALQILVVVTLIGIIAGLAVTRYGRGWFGTRASDLTAALAGIAGAFLGFHVGVAAGLTPVPVAGILSQSWERWSPFGCGGIANGLSDPKWSESAHIKGDRFTRTPPPAAWSMPPAFAPASGAAPLRPKTFRSSRWAQLGCDGA